MSLNNLGNFIKNAKGDIVLINPNDLDSNNSITNQGNLDEEVLSTLIEVDLENS
jgi:hypothetical protein